MGFVRSVVLAQLRHHPGRYAATALAIVLGTAFVTVGFLFTSTLRATLGNALVAPVARADVVVGPGSALALGLNELTAAQVSAVTDTPGVAASTVRRGDHGSAELPRLGAQGLELETVAADPRLRAERVVAGRLPSAAGELAVGRSLADATGLGPGASLAVQLDGGTATDATATDGTGTDGTGTDGTVMVRYRVVGTLDPPPGSALFGGGLTAYVPDTAPTPAASVRQVALVARAGTSVDALRTAVAARLTAAAPDGYTSADTAGSRDDSRIVASTVAGYRASSLASIRVAVDVIGAFVLAFAVLALAVATLVIANTFVILLTQRTRELALLRCVGAVRRQVFRSVVAEAAVLGVVSAAVGIGLAVGLGNAAVGVANRFELPLVVAAPAVTWPAVVVPLLAGLLVTVLAALAPARRATAVAPVAALRQDLGLAVRNRRGVVRLVLGVVLVLAGVAGVLGGQLASGTTGVALVTVGAMLTFVGLVVAARLYVPGVARLVGTAVRAVGGVPGRIGVLNVLRNPQRATATTTALVIGVTLVATVGVGAATARSSSIGYVLGQNPVDVTVSASDGSGLAFGESGDGYQPAAPTALPAATTALVPRVSGVAAAVPVAGAQLRVRVAGGQPVTGTVSAVRGDPSGVIREDAAAGLSDGTLLLGGDAYGDIPADGSRVTVTGPAGSRVLTVHTAASLPVAALVTDTTLRAVAGGSAAVTAVWARTAALDPGGDIDRVDDTVNAVRTAVGNQPQSTVGGGAGTDVLSVSGGAEVAASLVRVLTALVRVLSALLALALVIALVGIANTLSLSVLERRRETGLLRALGLGRGALRASIVWEAVTLAVVAVVVGVLLGTAYGWLGARAVFSGGTSGEITTRFALPLGQLGLLVAVAVAAGVLASLLPARRAASTSPAQVLAED